MSTRADYKRTASKEMPFKHSWGSKLKGSVFSTELDSDKQNSQEKSSFALTMMMMICLGAVAAFAANSSYCDESVSLVTFEVVNTLTSKQ